MGFTQIYKLCHLNRYNLHTNKNSNSSSIEICYILKDLPNIIVDPIEIALMVICKYSNLPGLPRQGYDKGIPLLI